MMRPRGRMACHACQTAAANQQDRNGAAAHKHASRGGGAGCVCTRYRRSTPCYMTTLFREFMCLCTQASSPHAEAAAAEGAHTVILLQRSSLLEVPLVMPSYASISIYGLCLLLLLPCCEAAFACGPPLAARPADLAMSSRRVCCNVPSRGRVHCKSTLCMADGGLLTDMLTVGIYVYIYKYL